MSDITRDDISLLHSAIGDVRSDVSEVRRDVSASEIRLGQRIDAQRAENETKFVTPAQLELVKKDVVTLAGVVEKALGRKDWGRKTVLVATLAFVGNLILEILNHIPGWSK